LYSRPGTLSAHYCGILPRPEKLGQRVPIEFVVNRRADFADPVRRPGPTVYIDRSSSPNQQIDVSSPVATPTKFKIKRALELISSEKTSLLTKKIKSVMPEKLYPVFNKPSTCTAALPEDDIDLSTLEFVSDKEEQILQGMTSSTALKLDSVSTQHLL